MGYCNMLHRWPMRKLLAIILALELICVWWLLCVLTWHIDAVTYLAAGERLNAGHALYSLMPGDRALAVDSSAVGTPILYPPLIAVLWRPLSALPAMTGLYLWFAAAAVAIFTSIWYVARDLRWSAIAVLLIFSAGIGSQLRAANIEAFIILTALLLWDQSDRRPWVGVSIGVLTAIKVSPGIFIVWLISQRRWGAVRWAAAGLIGGFLVGLIGVGLDAHVQAFDMLRSSKPQNLTITGLTVIPWATWAVDVFGALSILLVTKHPKAAFRLAALTIIFGSPQISLGVAAYALLLVLPMRRGCEARGRRRGDPRGGPAEHRAGAGVLGAARTHGADAEPVQRFLQ